MHQFADMLNLIPNVSEAAKSAIEAGAAVTVDSAEALVHTADRLLQDEAGRARMGQRGIEFSRAHQGATARIVAMLDEVMRE